MRNAKTILGIIRERGKRGLPRGADLRPVVRIGPGDVEAQLAVMPHGPGDGHFFSTLLRGDHADL
jgi:hypothetical protein